MSRIYARFVELWTHPDYPPTPIELAEIELLESKINTFLPKNYKDAIKHIGILSTTIDLLDAIVDGDYDLSDISEIHSMEEIYGCTTGWREVGLPQNMIAIACDCMGNQFCLKVSQKRNNVNSKVYFWDHDLNEVSVIAKSFDKWIKQYNKLTRL